MPNVVLVLSEPWILLFLPVAVSGLVPEMTDDPRWTKALSENSSHVSSMAAMSTSQSVGPSSRRNRQEGKPSADDTILLGEAEDRHRRLHKDTAFEDLYSNDGETADNPTLDVEETYFRDTDPGRNIGNASPRSAELPNISSDSLGMKPDSTPSDNSHTTLSDLPCRQTNHHPPKQNTNVSSNDSPGNFKRRDYTLVKSKDLDNISRLANNVNQRTKRQEVLLKNVALNKPAWLSTNNPYYSSTTNANDGDFRTDIQYCVHTGFRDHDLLPYRFWRVDLEGLYQVHYVTVTNRGDCCGYRLRNFTIRLGRKMADEMAPELYKEQVCARVLSAVADGATVRLDCEKPLPVGRYLTLLMNAMRENDELLNSPLHFCELEAFALPVTERAAGMVCDNSTENLHVVCELDTICIFSINRSTSYCRVPVGGNCNKVRRYRNCVATTVCDKGICKKDFNQDCSSGNQQFCRSGSECQEDVCKIQFGGSCTGRLQNKCVKGLVCDFLSTCKLSRGDSCISTTQCSAGSSCSPQLSTCQCSIGNSNIDPTERFCVPKPGSVMGTCEDNTPCIDYNAQCTDGACQCRSPFRTVISNYTCGGQLICDDDADCAFTNGFCENPGTLRSKCALRLGGSCPSAFGNCTAGSTCEELSGTCRIMVGQDCENQTDLCVTGATCEDGQKCKMQLDQPCTVDNDCVRRHSCDSGSGNECRLSVGVGCYGMPPDACYSNTVCDKSHQCRLEWGQSCGEGRPCSYIYECDNETRTCRVSLKGNCSRNKNSCTSGAICDFLSFCGLKNGSQCDPQGANVCVSGAICITVNANRWFCWCNSSIASVTKEGICVPLPKMVGYNCTSSEDCADPNAACLNRTCQCTDGFTVEQSSLACRLKPGQPCGDGKLGCVSGSVCDDVTKECALEPGQSCVGVNRGHCHSSSVCEDQVCKLTFNENCSGSKSSRCKSGIVCDFLNMCRKPSGANCSKLFQTCLAGSACVNGICQCDSLTADSVNNICVPKHKISGGTCTASESEVGCMDFNAKCVEGVCQCEDGFTLDDHFTCMKMPGQLCFSEDNNCIRGTVCEGGSCKKDLGSWCGDSNDVCVSGTVCDEHLTCSLDLNQNCNDVRLHLCRSGSICDNAFICGLAVGSNCSRQDSCVSGALCTKGVCTCNSFDLVIPNGLLCLPKDGLVGGPCGSLVQCKDPKAMCVEGVCMCTETNSILQKHDYSCRLVNEESAMPLVWLYILLGCVGILFILLSSFIALIIHRRRMKQREDLLKEINTRSHAMDLLVKGVLSLHALEAAGIQTNFTKKKVFSTDEKSEEISFDDKTKDVSSSDGKTENVSSSDGKTEDVSSSDGKTENVSSSDGKTENVSSSDGKTENVSSSDVKTEDVFSTDYKSEDVFSTDEKIEDVVSTDDKSEDRVSTDDKREGKATSPSSEGLLQPGAQCSLSQSATSPQSSVSSM